MMGYRQQRPKIGLTVCPDLVDHYSTTFFFDNQVDFDSALF